MLNIKDILLEQKRDKVSDSLYKYTIVSQSFHTNKIEGSTLSLEQTNDIYEFGRISGESSKVNDVIEMQNSFQMFDYMLDTIEEPLSESLIKEFHRILKSGTEDSRKAWFTVGDYKKRTNMVGMLLTTDPEDVPDKMYELLLTYGAGKTHTLDDILRFHVQFETIHPFQDGNGRVGRLVMFRECLKNNITPFIVSEDRKYDYVLAIREYNSDSKVFEKLATELANEYMEVVKKFTKVFEKQLEAEN